MTAGLALIAGLVLACADPALAHDAAVEEADASRGIVVDGLSPGGDVCPGAFVLASDLPGRPRCSHGPDEPLPGVDVSADAATMVLPDSAPPVECYGDGTDGRRVQAVYAVAADRPDRYDALVGASDRMPRTSTRSSPARLPRPAASATSVSSPAPAASSRSRRR